MSSKFFNQKHDIENFLKNTKVCDYKNPEVEKCLKNKNCRECTMVPGCGNYK